ncbi:aspartic peptidase domain-containing protein [Diplogelasinospora grovesii]|uniref:Probable aspartic-type endopeptidase OPSB n=1 Tax=Diplogelasinospora grovesii TaxID=303347 RepID=A0AAN6S592_9PEZI|nr:aspartic peptidase domain-containing protein [Diplogelasinospora grovesii]
MKSSTLLALAASLLPSSTEGLALQQQQQQQRRDGSSPRVVGLETKRQPIANPLSRDKLRRRGSVTASLDNEETLYFVNATLGTPAQSFRLHLDTGSSDLWVNTPSSKLCLQKSAPCKFAGTYSANSSSTYSYIGSYFNISYVDGSGASGDYVSDTITIGATKLDKLQFGIGYTSSSAQGILGIGYPINEVQVGRAGKAAYDNLPAQMVADGLIQSKAYSLWLNDLDSNTGSILFGGVDTEQYTGSLQTVPIQSESGTFAEFLITLTKLQMGATTIADNLALAVLLDSGSSLTYLPDALVQDIYNAVGAQYDSEEGAAYVPCSLANNATNLTFTFSEPEINVQMDELVLDLVTASGKRPTFQNGVAACLFGIAPAGSGTNVLGDTFIRSAYLVYDLDNNQISLAQTRFNSTASNVLEIGTGANAVPDATVVTNAVSATAGIAGGSAASSSGLGIAKSGAAAAVAGRGGGAHGVGGVVVMLTALGVGMFAIL